MDLSGLSWDAAGLVTVVAQDRHTGEVRMVAHADEAALRATVARGRAVFFSRSRQRQWMKGETSGHTMRVHEVWVDCDADAVVYLVDPEGPSCHTGRDSCFFRRLGSATDEPLGAAPTLTRLFRTLDARRRATADASYTKSLLDAGPAKIGDKIREEAGELAVALDAETDERVVSEAADVLYHLAVGLLARGLSLRDVEAELARRFGASGHDEKASRPR
jgi:phosphoribosyl-ATP pyrophosphohydrolase/phosphoribosyl-AMP cyclohydrolase